MEKEEQKKNINKNERNKQSVNVNLRKELNEQPNRKRIFERDPKQPNLVKHSQMLEKDCRNKGQTRNNNKQK